MGFIIKPFNLPIVMYILSIVTVQDTSAIPITDDVSTHSIIPELSLDTLPLKPNREERHFFNSGIATCNYAVTPGRTCHGCHQTMTCLESNIAFVKRCPFFSPHCKNGLCSFTPGLLCNAASTSTSSTSSSSSTTTTTTTTTPVTL